ncbi:MAG: hypothetical protein S0880_37285 [Actinomycetota bacterium]|nr:hypothetical protein [Actinomycetota bacterium]
MRTNGRRADARENRRRLIDAVERLLVRDGTVTLGDLAEESGVSRSTTYRNFATADDAVAAFVDDFLDAFETAATGLVDQHPDGAGRLRALCAAWGDLVAERSPALVHVRSTDGFLARVRSGDPVIGRIHRIVGSTIQDGVEAGDFAEVDVDYAVFLWNLLLDPRELLDLAEHRSISVAAATSILTDELVGILARPAVPGVSADG